MTPKKLRDVLRVVHLVTSLYLGYYVYSPIWEHGLLRLIGRVVVFPTMVITGLWMWQQARVRRWFRKRRSVQDAVG